MDVERSNKNMLNELPGDGGAHGRMVSEVGPEFPVLSPVRNRR